MSKIKCNDGGHSSSFKGFADAVVKLEETKEPLGEVPEAVTSMDISIQDLASSISELKRRLEGVLMPELTGTDNSATRVYQTGLASRLGDFNSYIRTNTEILNDMLNRLQL